MKKKSIFQFLNVLVCFILLLTSCTPSNLTTQTIPDQKNSNDKQETTKNNLFTFDSKSIYSKNGQLLASGDISTHSDKAKIIKKESPFLFKTQSDESCLGTASFRDVARPDGCNTYFEITQNGTVLQSASNPPLGVVYSSPVACGCGHFDIAVTVNYSGSCGGLSGTYTIVSASVDVECPPEEEEEPLTPEEIEKMAEMIFGDCNNFRIKDIDLGKGGPSCPKGGKLTNILDIIDFAGQIIEAHADDKLQAAINEAQDAKDKANLVRLQKKVKEIRESLKEVDSLRSEFNLGKGKNIGTLKGTINGEKIDSIGVSGPGTGVSNNSNIRGSSNQDKLSNVDNIPKDQRILKVEQNRYTDSEVKMLEEVAQKLEKNPNAKGNINLFSERKPCAESCQGVINQFKDRYGDRVTINVLYGGR